MRRYLFILLIIITVTVAAQGDEALAVKAGKIIRPGQNTIENGIILIKEGIIENVLSGSDIPPGYRILDYSQFRAYPGIINSHCNLGLSGISMVSEWNDYRERGKFNPQISAFTALYPWGNLIPITRDFGTTVVLSVPSGGVVCGKAMLIRLSGWSPQDMLIE